MWGWGKGRGLGLHTLGERKTLLVFGGLSGTRSDWFLGGPGAGQGVLGDILQPQLTVEQLQGSQPNITP